MVAAPGIMSASWAARRCWRSAVSGQAGIPLGMASMRYSVFRRSAMRRYSSKSPAAREL